MFSSAKKVSKIVIAGNGGIGKTTLLKRFCYDIYTEDQRLTVGSEIFIKKYKVEDKVEYMQIWDLGGQEHFRFLFDNLIRGATGAILGFDIRRRKSFMDLKQWLELLRSNNPNLPIVLIATKLDLGYHPTLNPTMGKSFVDQNSLVEFVELSSKDKQNVSIPFIALIQHLNCCGADDIEFLEYELDIKPTPTLTPI